MYVAGEVGCFSLAQGPGAYICTSHLVWLQLSCEWATEGPRSGQSLQEGLAVLNCCVPFFASPVSHLVHLAGFGPQPVSWTAPSTGAVTPSPSAVCVTRSGCRISSGCRWGTARATVVCDPHPGMGTLAEKPCLEPGVGTVPGTCCVWAALMRCWHQDTPLCHLLGRWCLIGEWHHSEPSREHSLRVEFILSV